MHEMGTPLRVLRYSAANALADLTLIYTPLTWTLGWLGRVVLQVVFFALVGVLLDSPEDLRFLFVGNAVMATAMEAMMCVASTTWERRAGTLPLLVAAPSRLWPVFVGRSLQWLPSGVATASVALFAVGPAFGLQWTIGSAVGAFGCLIVVAVTTYCVGLAVAAVVLAAMDLRNIAGNVSYIAMMLLCGVMVPVPFWPGWVQALAQGLPLTRALAAIRTLAGPAQVGPALAGTVVRDCLLALAVGTGWLVLAAVLLERLAQSGRRTGSIEFAD
jgi:ABC-2 type transport system permease protein